MRCRNIPPELIGALLGAFLTVLLGCGAGAFFSRLLDAASAAETARLLDAFDEPLALALAQGDDLARIDSLSRLQKLPGVLKAEADMGPAAASSHVRQLSHQGKRVGHLEIKLSQTHWRRLQGHWTDLFSAGLILMSLAGGGCGGWVRSLTRKHRLRLAHLRVLRRNRRRAALDRLQERLKNELIPWTHQAMGFVKDGLVLLNAQQCLVACNDRAREAFDLRSDSLGKHWLDLQKSSDWAAALERSISAPGQWIGASSLNIPSDVSLLTSAPKTTWILVHAAVSSPQPVIV